MGQRGLKTFGIALLILTLILIIGSFFIFTHKPSTVSATSNVVSQNSEKLSNNPYVDYAYLISSDILSSDAHQAIAGFQLQKTDNADGTITINLIALNPEYQNQSYTLQPGQNLYFIEKSFGDDSEGSENFLADDHAIIVDSSGYIIQGPTNFN